MSSESGDLKIMEYRIPSGKKVRVAISGKSGCGNTTVSTLLSKRLGVRLVNFTFRQLAEEKGMTLAQVIEAAKTSDDFDIEVDTRQVELAREDSCVLGSRLAIWMLKEADLKVYLLTNEEIRAKRIQNREGGSLEEIAAFTKMRDGEDTRRYKKLYGIDNCDFHAAADIVIDVSEICPEQIVETILSEMERRGLVEKAN